MRYDKNATTVGIRVHAFPFKVIVSDSLFFLYASRLSQNFALGAEIGCINNLQKKTIWYIRCFAHVIFEEGHQCWV